MRWGFQAREHGFVKKLRLGRPACGDAGTGSVCFFLRDGRLLADLLALSVAGCDAGGYRAASRQRRRRRALVVPSKTTYQ